MDLATAEVIADLREAIQEVANQTKELVAAVRAIEAALRERED